MASEVDICNLAIGHLGQSRLITSVSPPDGSTEATLCQKFYPIALQATLELHDWGFAQRHIGLALSGTAPAGWEYQYAVPSAYVKIRNVYITDDDTPQEYDIGSDPSTGATVIWSNVNPVTAVYTALITDVNRFGGLFKITLSHMLASFLAGPIIKGKAGQAEGANQRQQVIAWLGQATLSDANSRAKQTEAEPAYESLRVRPGSIRSRS